MISFQHKNHPFTTADLLMLFSLVGIVATLSGAVLARGLQDERPGRAQTSAEAFAIQLLQNHTPASHSRAPASESSSSVLPLSGEIGRDPWGHAFHYQIQDLHDKGLRRVVVWSDGPNLKSESNGLPFGGDDVGFVREQKLAQ